MLEQFEKCLKRANFFLKFIGLCLDGEDNNKNTVFEWISSHRIYSAHFISFNLEVIAQMSWYVEAVITGKTFLEITYLLPCLTLCFLSDFKTVSFLYYNYHIEELINVMKNLQPNRNEIEEGGNFYKKDLIDKHVSMLINNTRKIIYLIVLGVLMFALGPLFIILPRYYKTGEVKFELPFIAYYPFDEFNLRIYPWLYLHQMWSATEAVLMVYGPDCVFFTLCTFVHIQFLLLQYDMERIVNEKSHKYDKVKFKRLVVRHIELMRCVELLEKIFSKSILFNALTSSVIICVTGFNVLVVKNIVIMASFMAFLIFGLLQIFLYCYYGDSIMKSSMKVSDAIYHSQWYKIKAAERKTFIIVLMRSQKPCKLTAYGFFNINLGAFTSILSTSWSYFALLKTIYHPE